MAGPAASVHEEALLRPLSTFRPKLFIGSLLTGLLVALLFYAWGFQMVNDIGVAGITRPVFWGFYIVNFVFWIGISHAGTLISAILRVTQAEWRRPVTRCAETITTFARHIYRDVEPPAFDRGGERCAWPLDYSIIRLNS